MKARRWLIVGAGSIGRRHLGNLQALGQRELCVVDPDAAARQQAEQQYGALAVADLEAGLARRPDAVIIATPTSMHVPVALAAVRAGSHLFIEKPLSDRLAGVEELLSIVQSRNLVTLVGCNMQFHPGPRLIKQVLEQGTLGPLLGARLEVGSYLPSWHPGADYRAGYSANPALGGGCVLDAIHELDLACWFFGFPSEVLAATRPGETLGIETEAMAEIVLSYERGPLCSVHLDYVQRWRQRRAEVIGRDGTVVWESRRRSVEWLAGDAAAPERLGYDDAYDPNTMYVEELKHFLACLDGQAASCADVAWAARVTELALAVKQSAREHQPIAPGLEAPWSS